MDDATATTDAPFALHACAYEIVNAPGHDGERLTLHDAVHRLIELQANGGAHDSSFIRRGGRIVAFWCGWTNTFRVTDFAEHAPQRGSHPQERHVIRMWTRAV